MNRPNLLLVRGLPGSGKSTYVTDGYPDYVLLEADMFRYVNDIYVYDRAKNSDAHNWCKYSTMFHLNKGKDVAVTSVFSKLKHIAQYIRIAENYKANLQIVELDSQFVSIHGVPESEMERLRVTYQPLPESWKNINERI